MHQLELSGFFSNAFVDIPAVLDEEREAMEAVAPQSYLRERDRARAAQRAVTPEARPCL